MNAKELLLPLNIRSMVELERDPRAAAYRVASEIFD